MKKLLIISLLSLSFVLSGCQSGDRSEDSYTTEPTEDQPTSRVFWGRDLRPVTVTRTTLAPTGEQVERPAPATIPATPVSFNQEIITLGESGSYTVSMVHPSTTYGVIQVDKTMPREVPPDKPFNYSIKVTNLIDVTLTDVMITEDLPSNFKYAGAMPTPKKDGQRLVWTISPLEPRTSKTITVSGMATDIHGLEHCTIVTQSARACANVEVVQPRLELVRVAPAEVLLCDPIHVEFVVTNSGTGFAHNIKIVDALASGLQTEDGKSTLVLDAGNLAAGQSRQLSAQLRATVAGMYTNKAVASSAFGLKAESVTTTTYVRQPVLEIVKTGPDLQYLGRPISYQITVTNKGDGLAKDTVVEDIVPVGVTSVEATAGAESVGSKVIWELGTLSPNTAKTVNVSYTPTSAGELMSSATASAYCAESATVYAKTSIAGIPAVTLEVIDLQDPVEVGKETTYLITVANHGSADDTNVRIVCILEDKVRYVSATGATTGSLMGRTVSFAPLNSLAPRAKATWRIVVRGIRPGDVRFKATLHTDQLLRPVEEDEATHLYE